ncbi:tRNA lysidine(34) synthetase TilS [Natranaerobius trueperi]|uniref:tRNA(Ile)-lysidine synthase n=1 Tax=Natranaerobius trueperi TaxID=759412 RepID=A0A226BW86_9FIRM|nr:tRNA lysidine(34) synthetase TilS [Natranaerobius trueperi]OWZ83266.1 tRNA lysidine(34) synthetase TilS [Natranaerobius trueperi]
MKRRIKKFITVNELIRKDDNVVVGVSGGPDSVALLHVLYVLSKELLCNIYIAHLNHGFREKSAQEDALFVRNLAKQYKLPIVEEKWDVTKYIKENKLSSQQGARIKRYQFFEYVAEKLGANKIALAHHKDDQVETFLLRLLRGTGTQGLSGIPVKRFLTEEIEIIRPLLNVTKEEIIDYLNKLNLTFQTDPTNEETNYQRNKIRHEVVPLLTNINPQLPERIFETMEILEEEDNYLDKKAQNKFNDALIDSEETVVALKVSELVSALKPILRRTLIKGVRLALNLIGAHNKHDVTKHHIDLLLETVESGNTGKYISLPGKLSAFLDVTTYGKTLKIKPLSHIKTEDMIQKNLILNGWTYWPLTDEWIYAEIKDISEFNGNNDNIKNKNQKKAYLDYECINSALIIRSRKPGDRLIPLGMTNNKKLKDFLIDNKVPKAYRDKLPLVTLDDQVLWVVGYRINHKFRVTSKTKKILYLEVMNNEEG